MTIAVATAHSVRARERRLSCASGRGRWPAASGSPSSICTTVVCHEFALTGRSRCGTGNCPASAARSSATLRGLSCGLGASIQSHTCSNRSGTPPCPDPARRGCSSLTARAVADIGALPVIR
ncbi:MAG: hypothetical protein LKCHEGNO_03238 [Burkholderiaceae bacterium]|nr:hypothetical protein [Burkholderiaceae bacterium]